MHMIADLSSEKFNLHLSQCSVELYECVLQKRRCVENAYY